MLFFVENIALLQKRCFLWKMLLCRKNVVFLETVASPYKCCFLVENVGFIAANVSFVLNINTILKERQPILVSASMRYQLQGKSNMHGSKETCPIQIGPGRRETTKETCYVKRNMKGNSNVHGVKRNMEVEKKHPRIKRNET
jgi:hypothetical protein